MAGLQLIAEQIGVSLDIPGPFQQLKFSDSNSKFSLNNIYAPVVGGSSNIMQLETRNSYESGFRWIHETPNATQGTNAASGSYSLYRFLNNSATTQLLLTFDSSGNATFPNNVNVVGNSGADWADLGTPKAPVDFGGQKLLNVGTGSAATDGVNLGQIQTLFTNLTLTSNKITDFATAVTAFRLDQFAAPTAALNLNNQKITNLLNPTANQDATPKLWVDNHTWLSASITDLATTVKAYTLNSFAPPTANLNLNSQKIVSLLDPTLAQDAATKIYVDSHTWLAASITDLAATVKAYTLNSFAIPTGSLNLNSQKIINLLDPTAAQDGATKNYIDTKTWTTSQITNFSAAVLAFRLDQFAAPTTSVSMNSQKIINLLNPTANQDASTKIYVDSHTWTTSQITDFATALQSSLNTINLTGAVTGTLQAGNTIPTLQSATQSFNFWRQTINWNPATGTNPSPVLPSGAPYYSWTHNLPDTATPPLHYYETVVGNRTLRFAMSPGASSTQTGGFSFVYLNSGLSANVTLFDLSMNSGNPLASLNALLNMNSKQIINVVDPTTAQGVATKNYVDIHLWAAASITDLASTVQAYTLNTFAPPVSGINMNNQRMINLQNPVLAQDAATKTFVDTHTWTTSQITDFTSAVTSFRIDQFAPPQGNLNLNGLNIDNLNSLGIGRTAVGTARLSFSNVINSRKITLYDASGANDNYNYSGFGASATDTIYNCPSNGAHTFYTGANGNIAMQVIGLQLHLDSTNSTADYRKIVFWYEDANTDLNQHQSVAIGNLRKSATDTIMRFQTSTTNGDFVFAAGASSTASNTVATIKGTGDVIVAGTTYSRFPSGTMTMQGNATATTVSTANAWVKVAGTTTATNLNQWSSPTSNRLTFTGTTGGFCELNIYLTASQNDAAMAEIRFAIYKNGILISSSIISTQMTMTVLNHLSFGVISSVATNDYFELFTSHPTAARTVLVKNLIITVTQT